MIMNKSSLGQTHAFYGNGKGKTTSALGTAIRALGNGYNVHLIQFMKNGASSLEQEIPGEILSLSKFENFSYKRFGVGFWYTPNLSEQQKQIHISSINETLKYLSKCLLNPNYDIIIADEILYAVQLSLLSEEKVIDLIKNKPKNKELILTGSHIPFPNIFSHCQLVTEIKKQKHPYDLGITARKGIEY
jgi:cob(I)alamin adenosyltransferase